MRQQQHMNKVDKIGKRGGGGGRDRTPQYTFKKYVNGTKGHHITCVVEYSDLIGTKV